MNECLICNNFINEDNNNNYIFYQECNCFYNNVHEECLVQWIKNSNKCVFCHKTIKHEKKNTFKVLNERKSFFKKYFYCCYK